MCVCTYVYIYIRTYIHTHTYMWQNKEYTVLQINIHKWRYHSQIPKRYAGRHYFLLHIGFLQIQRYTLKAQAKTTITFNNNKFFFPNYRKGFITVWKIDILGRKARQLLFLLFCAYCKKEICQVPTLEFLKPLILDCCGFLGEVSWF